MRTMPSVVAQLEQGLPCQRPETIAAVAQVPLETVGPSGKCLEPAEAMKDAQLRDVKRVIVPARKHRGCALWRFVERPPPCVEVTEARLDGAKTGVPEVLGLQVAGPPGVVVDAPERPDEAVQYVARRIDQILLDPDMTAVVVDQHPSLRDGPLERLECAMRAPGERGVTRRPRYAHEQGQAVSLRKAGVPGSSQQPPVGPVEVMKPDRNAVGVRPQLSNEPPGHREPCG